VEKKNAFPQKEIDFFPPQKPEKKGGIDGGRKKIRKNVIEHKIGRRVCASWRRHGEGKLLEKKRKRSGDQNPGEEKRLTKKGEYYFHYKGLGGG